MPPIGTFLYYFLFNKCQVHILNYLQFKFCLIWTNRMHFSPLKWETYFLLTLYFKIQFNKPLNSRHHDAIKFVWYSKVKMYKYINIEDLESVYKQKQKHLILWIICYRGFTPVLVWFKLFPPPPLKKANYFFRTILT